MAEPLLATGQGGGRERSGRLESIDVLRGVAVLSVVPTHALVPGFAFHHLVEGPRPPAERERA